MHPFLHSEPETIKLSKKGFAIVKVKRHRYVPDLYVVTRIVVTVYSLLASFNVAKALVKVYSLFKTQIHNYFFSLFPKSYL